MKRRCLSITLTLLFLLCLFLTACENSPLSAGERLARIQDLALDLPAHRLYDSASAIHESTYMPEGMAASLYDLSGYSELSHAESYAFCLSAHRDGFFECALFLAKDTSGVSELCDAVRVRGEFLSRRGYIDASSVHIYHTGRYVLAVYGLGKKSADRLAESVLE